MANDTQIGERCFRLTYRSTSKIDSAERETELASILKSSRKNNPAQNLTGALVLYDDWFAQILEGEEETVRALLTRIEKDPRHRAIKVFEEEHEVERAFGKWAMALVAEHGAADVPLVSIKDKVAEGTAWNTTVDQEVLVNKLRNLTRGYGIGS